MNTTTTDNVIGSADLMAKVMGRVGEIYVARNATVTVIVCDGMTYLINNRAGGSAIVNPVPSYWCKSIDWRGTLSSYMAHGMIPPASDSDWTYTQVKDHDLDLMGITPEWRAKRVAYFAGRV